MSILECELPGAPAPAELVVANVDVCICTFRRASLGDTVRSVAAQALPAGARLGIIVVDNDVEPEAQARVRALETELGISVRYVHAPARNISIARNAALDAATAEWIAFIDDDETALPGWLAALMRTAKDGGWDAVLGPVDAVYPENAPAWLKRLDLHSARPVTSAGRIEKGYAGNVLLRRASIEARKLRFDLARGRTGGEDDDFFYRLTDAGGRIGYAAEARVLEPVASARTELGWLVRRNFRAGQSHGSRLRARYAAAGRLAQLGLAAAKASACAAAACIGAPVAARRNRWLVRMSLHAGVVARLAGRSEIELY